MSLKYKIFFYCVSIVYLIVGISVHSNFGVTWDEPRNRQYGLEVVKTGNKTRYNEVLEKGRVIKDGVLHAASRGPAYLILLNTIEGFFNPENDYEIYKYRRLINHFFYWFCGLLFMLFLSQKYHDQKIVLIGYFMYLLCPRIYAHSFYNPVDTSMLCGFTLYIITLNSILKKLHLKTILLHAIVCGVLTSLRTVGEISLFASIFFISLAYYNQRSDEFKNFLIKICTFTILSIVVYIICTPYLWDSPWQRFWEMNQIATTYTPIIFTILYWGELYQSIELPWHYTLSWIAISLPTIYILELITSYLYNTANLRKYWKQNNIFLIAIFSITTIVLFTACYFNYSKYNDWRHFYFLYPMFIILVVESYRNLSNFRMKRIVVALFCLQFLVTAYDMYRYHPHQISYFNRLFGGIDKAQGKFPMEYFGSSYKQALEVILEAKQTKKKIKVRFFPYPPGEYNLNALPPQQRNRFEFAKSIEDTDYILSKWIFAPHTNNSEIHERPIFKQLKVDNTSVHNIYYGKGK